MKKKKKYKEKYLYIEKEWNWSDVKLDIKKKDLQQVLIISNTTNDARNGFKELSSIYGENCYHLSTRMYPKHRLGILNKIKELLQNNQLCYLVSTQLIEAGVDLDFSDGYRVLAPLDSIVQSGGRINRNGKLNRLGTMTVFRLEDGKYPSDDYKSCARTAQQIIDDNNDFDIDDNELLELIKDKCNGDKDCESAIFDCLGNLAQYEDAFDYSYTADRGLCIQRSV